VDGQKKHARLDNRANHVQRNDLIGVSRLRCIPAEILIIFRPWRSSPTRVFFNLVSPPFSLFFTKHSVNVLSWQCNTLLYVQSEFWQEFFVTPGRQFLHFAQLLAEFCQLRPQFVGPRDIFFAATTAASPAPIPLSMFTTTIPGEHDDSMAFNATPPPEAMP